MILIDTPKFNKQFRDYLNSLPQTMEEFDSPRTRTVYKPFDDAIEDIKWIEDGE